MSPMTPYQAPAVLEVPVAGGPARGLCTDCGLSRTSDPKGCGQACQFIKHDYAGQESRVHRRARDPRRTDEMFFGPHRRMLSARLAAPAPGAQWTGITTRLAQRLLETGAVDAVLTMAPDPNNKWRPVPAIVTPRSDHTTTERFHEFLALLGLDQGENPDDISYLEFRADYHVELRYIDGRVRAIPFLQLPLSKLPNDFFPLTCRTCVDYTNVLSDITVGYMGGQGEQWLLVRNQRGEQLLSLLGHEVVTSAPGQAGKRAGAVWGFIANVERATAGWPLRRMPDWLRPLVGWLMPCIGPRGLEFARARIEMKAAETVIHLRREMPSLMKNMVPPHVWHLVKPYAMGPKDGEQS